MKPANIVLVVLTGLVGLCAVGGVVTVALTWGQSPSFTGATHAETKAGPSPTATSTALRHVKLGQPASDGKLEFVVRNVDCGKTKVGDDLLLSKAAQGQFCLVSVSVRNTGNETRTFDGDNQKAIGADGVKYANDSLAELYTNLDTQTVLNDINPGNQVSGVLVFDIAKGATITGLELHDSAFTDGVIVDVS
jgi:hypothetical protein